MNKGKEATVCPKKKKEEFGMLILFHQRLMGHGGGVHGGAV